MARPPFKNAIVNDLSAALGQPSLMIPTATMPCLEDGLYQRLRETSEDWLRKLDEKPDALQAHIAATPRNNRLGLYYEALLAFWLERYPQWSLLAHELPVYDGKRTMGAYDFVVQTPEELIHIEVAIKFYMGVTGAPGWDDWIGPGQNDFLGLKLDKMLERQLLLSQTSAGRETLKSAGISNPTSKRIWFKGLFFRPHDAASDAAPQGGRPATGVWYPLSAVKTLVDTHAAGYWVPRMKPDWIAPIALASLTDTAVRASELQNAVLTQWELNSSRPVMWSYLLPGANSGWCEAQRVFFAPDDWLASAKAGTEKRRSALAKS